MGDDFRVFVVTNAYAPRIGGIANYLSDVIRGLQRRGIQVDICAMPENFNRLDEAAKGSRLWWRTIHLVFTLAFVIQSTRRIIRLRRQGIRLVVHSHSASFCLAIGIIAKLLGSRTVHTFHSPLDRGSWILNTLALQSDALVFVSHALAGLYRSLGVLNRNSVVIPAAVDTSYFRPPTPEDRRLAREQVETYFNKTRTPGPMALFVGRLVPEKGVDVLLAAYQEVLEKMPDSRLVIVGPPDPSPAGRSYFARCVDLSAKGLLDGRVAFAGQVSDGELLKDYWAADVLVCPSTWPEPAAVVVSEGMACGLPVVASQVGGLHERIDDDVTGLLVPPSSPHALAAGILRVFREPATWKSFSMRARLKAVQDLGAELLVDRHFALYHSVLEGLGSRTEGETRT